MAFFLYNLMFVFSQDIGSQQVYTDATIFPNFRKIKRNS